MECIIKPWNTAFHVCVTGVALALALAACQGVLGQHTEAKLLPMALPSVYVCGNGYGS